MKQVTMESVKQRISKLASRGNADYALGLTLNEEFELACLRELVAVTEQVRLLTEQRDALVVENVALKSCAEFYNSGFSPVKGTFGLEWKPTEKLLEDCGNVASDALQTPATSSAIAALRAEAIRFAACHLPDNGKYQDIIYVLANEIEEGLTEFKFPVNRQLRESKGEVQS